MDNGITLQWLVSSLLVLLGFTFGVWQYVERRRQQLLIDLQGDKNAVAAVAMRVLDGHWPRRAARRRELFQALCLAAVFQRSGRARSLIYGALARASERGNHPAEIREIVDTTSVIVSRAWAYTDLSRARRMLDMLRAALDLDGDVRLRIDRFEVDAVTTRRRATPDARFNHPAFAWDAIAPAVETLGQLVLIAPDHPSEGLEGLDGAIALDYHRIARPLPSRRTERLRLTAMGELVIQAKYGLPQPSVASRAEATADLAGLLVEAIRLHPEFAEATSIAAVPSSSHDLSDALGRSVAAACVRTLVELTGATSDDGGVKFQVTNEADVTSRVILIDDVYRSGRTVQAAAVALRAAGAKEVLGLTVTCTLSAVGPPCDQDCAMETSP